MTISPATGPVEAPVWMPELYAPAGGRPPSLVTQGEDLASFDQTPQTTPMTPPAANVLPATPAPAAGLALPAPGNDYAASSSQARLQPTIAAGSGGSPQVGVNLDTLA
jgi:hypothetical protein